jgi:hypothetical protein
MRHGRIVEQGPFSELKQDKGSELHAMVAAE